MKLNKLFLLAPVAVLSLTSCGKQVRYSEDKYLLEYWDLADDVAYKEDGSFNILQLSDIHFTYLADNEYHFKFIQKTIDAAKTATGNKLHLIVITGDTFTFATKDTVKSCCNFFVKQKIPWTITFGNHDEQGYFSVDWLTNYLTQLSKKAASNLLFVDYPNDDVFGNANFVIDLNNDYGHSKDTRQIIIMDSNRYNYGEGMGYDYIHHDQIDWYERMFDYIKNDSKRAEAPNPTSLAFFHIPLPEFKKAYDVAVNDDDEDKFYKSDVYNGQGTKKDEPITRNSRGESESSPLVNSHFLKEIAECQVEGGRYYTQGIFVGHDHVNNYCVDYDYDKDGTRDITFGYGVKATNTVYYDNAYLGGQIIKFYSDGIHDDSFDLILHKYGPKGAN